MIEIVSKHLCFRDKLGFWGWLKRPFLKAYMKPFDITEIEIPPDCRSKESLIY